ncbi:VWA domain-containing protein [Actinomadura sp. KC216]|uniref:vWA domain-containing protein n=1 Tax=Actinomadura sp. KC216 TaxID=2530370 RepID=UPI001043F0F1|nr:vWA domain-containing protein [Actinomadura sp. KC216]TDB86460.1 VWA domain-containing protein [Actinomadura sp. KC216]
MTNDTRLVTIVLDRSGSMMATKADAEGGLRAFLETQKEAPGRTLVTLRQFDNEHETVFERVPLADVPAFELRPRGMTALLDAIGSTIASVNEHVDGLDEDDRPAEIVYVIITDGQENCSLEWTLDRVKEAITAERDKGRAVVFLAADQDAITVGASMGIGANTSMSYGGDNTAVAMASTGEMLTRGSRSGRYEFTDDERDEATS